MVSKKILGVAIAAAMLSQGAFAFTAGTTTPTTNVISAQTLVQGTSVVKTAGAVGTYYTVNATSGGSTIDTTMTGALGVGLATNQPVYIRVDLTNAVFATARGVGDVSLADSAAGTVTETVSQGGDPVGATSSTDNYVIYSMLPSSGAKFNINSVFSVALGDLLVKGTGAVGVKVTAYDQLASAVAGTPVLSTSNATAALSFVTNGLAQTATALSPVASVEKVFKEFTVVGGTSTALLGTVGSYATTITSGVVSATTGLSVAAASEVANTTTSTVKYVGDFSVGTWALSANPACGTTTAVTVNTAKTEATATLADAIAKPFLCVTLPSTSGAGTTSVPASTYTASVTYTAISGAATAIGAQAASATSNLGSITRDGTTVRVPFITLNPGFNQKIFVVNRGTTDAKLTVDGLVPDAGATGFALTPAGAAGVTLPAGKQTELVSTAWFQVDPLATTKRGAATLNIAAPSSKVDVLIQTTNAEGAQNTVILQNDGKKFGGN